MNRQTSITQNLSCASICDWLLNQTLTDAELPDTVRGLARRLTDAGVAIQRISIGGMLLHPVYGALDLIWESKHDELRHQRFPRSVLASEDFQNSPFFTAVSDQKSFYRYRLENTELPREFPLFTKLRSSGATDYIVIYHSYGHTDETLWKDLPPGVRGVLCGFSTDRSGGFTDTEIECLIALSRPLAIAVKNRTSGDLARTVLDTYLGRYSGGHVLNGLMKRGDGHLIDCVLWYCDLRDSTRMADSMPLEDFLVLLNEYFDCTAGSVIDHGGEVLCYIGDAVFAIFPVGESRPARDMAVAAMKTTRTAMKRVSRLNSESKACGKPVIEFGVSLHVGQVMYGNVGTEDRLNFTVTGPSANEVVRLEAQCKKLSTSLVASRDFTQLCPDEHFEYLGNHDAAGVEGGLDVYSIAKLFTTGHAPAAVGIV